MVKTKKTQLFIVMHDVSGLADRSNTFANFLAVTRKFGYHCIYLFHIFYWKKEIQRKIIWQTSVFNIFPSSVPYQTVARLPQSNVIRTTTKYLPARSLWTNKLFIELANDNEKTCLTIDCSGVNFPQDDNDVKKRKKQQRQV